MIFFFILFKNFFSTMCRDFQNFHKQFYYLKKSPCKNTLNTTILENQYLCRYYWTPNLLLVSLCEKLNFKWFRLLDTVFVVLTSLRYLWDSEPYTYFSMSADIFNKVFGVTVQGLYSLKLPSSTTHTQMNETRNLVF